MTDDGKRTYQLLSHLNDWCPSPKASLRRADSRETPTEKVDCDRCGGKGTLKNGEPCAYCTGKGTRLVDAYTRETELASPVKPASARFGERTVRQIDRELSDIAANQAFLEGREVRDGDTGALDRREKMLAQGAFPALIRELELLAQREPTVHLAVMRFVVNAEPVVLYEAMQKLIDDVCDEIGYRMPKPIRVPLWARDPEPQEPGKGRHANGYAQAERNKRVLAMYVEGFPCGTIARTMGLTKRRVQQIVEPLRREHAA